MKPFKLAEFQKSEKNKIKNRICLFGHKIYLIGKKNQSADTENSKNPNHRYFLEKRLNELKFLEEYRQNKEFYLFFFAENEKAIFERENLLLRLSSDSMKLKKINNEKKIKILFKLNNQNSKT